MSVVKSERKESKLEFFHNATELRKSLTFLLLKDFGVKNKVRKTLSVSNKMSDDDKKIFDELMTKYNISSVVDEFPLWFIDKIRTNMMNLTYLLVANITAANSIYPVYESEYYERRKYQDKAIGNCEQLLQEMQYIITIIPVDANKYLPYVDMIEKEIKLIKGWRQSDNKLLTKIKEKIKTDE